MDSDPGAADLLGEVPEAVKRGDWPAVRATLKAAAAAITGDTALDACLAIGDGLERMEELEDAFRVLAAAGRRLRGTVGPEWDGGRPAGGPLLVEQRIRDIGAPIRTGRLAGLAARRLGGCQLLINPRLAALFARSFPQVEVFAAGHRDAELRAAAGAVASFETLAGVLTPSPTALGASFLPLVADAGRVSTYRRRWSHGSAGRPLVGVSWASTNTGKDTPDLESWARFLRRQEAVVVSLQYGDANADLDAWRRLGADVVSDPAIRPLGDLDVFAAQVAALDAVVTVSNTTAHMAGALGVRTVTVLDDAFSLAWPAVGRSSPWYPGMTLVRRSGRDWDAVFRDVDAALGR